MKLPCPRVLTRPGNPWRVLALVLAGVLTLGLLWLIVAISEILCEAGGHLQTARAAR